MVVAHVVLVPAEGVQWNTDKRHAYSGGIGVAQQCLYNTHLHIEADWSICFDTFPSIIWGSRLSLGHTATAFGFCLFTASGLWIAEVL